MKKTLLFFFALTVAVGASAHNDPERMSIKVAGYEVQLDGRERKSDHRHSFKYRYHGSSIGVLEVGFNNFRTYDNTYALYSGSEAGFMDLDIARSVDVTLNLSTFSASLVRNALGVSMALGVAYDQYSLDDPMPLAKTGGVLRPVGGDNDLKRSKLRSLALHVPLVIEITPARNFFLSAGGYADLVFWSSAKWKSPKEKFRNPYFNFLQAGLTARIGFRDVYIFGNYDITELFETGKGPRVNPYTFGLGFGF